MLDPRPTSAGRARAALVAATACAGLLGSCASTGDGAVSSRDRELATADLGRIPNAEVVVGSDQPIGSFLAAIDVRIERWVVLKASGDPDDGRRREGLEDEIERFVSLRFNELVFELQSGPLRNRWIAAAGLGFAREEEVLGPLLAALDDPVRDVVGQALFGLGVRGDAATPLEPLLAELRGAFENHVRVNASYAIFRVVRAGARTEGLEAALRRALLDSEAPVRIQAAQTLGVLLDAEAVDDLGALLGDRIDLVFLAGLEALAAIAEGDLTQKGPVARELVTALDSAPPGRRERIRHAAAELAGTDFGGDLEYWRRWAFGLP